MSFNYCLFAYVFDHKNLRLTFSEILNGRHTYAYIILQMHTKFKSNEYTTNLKLYVNQILLGAYFLSGHTLNMHQMF